MSAFQILSATVTGPGASFPVETKGATFQVTAVGTGTVTCSVDIEVSNNNTNWLKLATVALNGATPKSDGFATLAPWGFVRANPTSITAGSPTITVTMAA